MMWLIIILLVLGASPAQAEPSSDVVLEITGGSTFLWGSTKIELFRREAAGQDIWIGKLTNRRRGQRDQVRWADGRTCAALGSQLEALSAVGRTWVIAPGAGGNINVIDGDDYLIRIGPVLPVVGAPAGVEMRDSSGSWVGDQVDSALEALKPCWRRTRPRLI